MRDPRRPLPHLAGPLRGGVRPEGRIPQVPRVRPLRRRLALRNRLLQDARLLLLPIAQVNLSISFFIQKILRSSLC